MNLASPANIGTRRERSPSRSETFAAIVFVAFFVLCLLGGGASRTDVLSLAYVQPAAVLTIAALLTLTLDRDWRTYRSLFVMLAAFASLMTVQLVPLPPSWWLGLPGRATIEGAAPAAGLVQPWRPLSMTPDRTLQSLLTLLFPMAGLLAFASIGRQRNRRLLMFLIGATVASAALAILQLTAGEGSPFHLYNITHRGAAVGVFANRNHQAALLAICIPMLRVWTLLPRAEAQYKRVRTILAFGLGLFLVAMILVTGSRAGLALGALGLVMAGLIAPITTPIAARWSRTLRLAVLALPLLMVAVVFAFGRATAIQRLLVPSLTSGEARVEYIPIMTEIARDFFPIGAGFGAFDQVFPIYEPDDRLNLQYFNHAHNEIFELAITGGAPALALLAIFLAWYLHSSYQVFRTRSSGISSLFGRLGSMIVLSLLLASLVDYPLRTPLLALVFSVGCCWLAQGLRSGRSP